MSYTNTWSFNLYAIFLAFGRIISIPFCNYQEIKHLLWKPSCCRIDAFITIWLARLEACLRALLYNTSHCCWWDDNTWVTDENWCLRSCRRETCWKCTYREARIFFTSMYTCIPNYSYFKAQVFIKIMVAVLRLKQKG